MGAAPYYLELILIDAQGQRKLVEKFCGISLLSLLPTSWLSKKYMKADANRQS